MKLTGYKLRRLVESVLHEAYEEGTPGTSRDPKNKAAIKIENKKTSTGAENQVFKMLKDTIKPAKIGDVYYIWEKWEKYWDGAPQELGKRGSEYGISKDNDPYTYIKEGDSYRVVSGPKPGPIGKTFKPKKQQPKKDDDIEDVIEELFAKAKFNCTDNYVDAYKDSLVTSAQASISRGKFDSGIEDIAQKSQATGSTNVPLNLAVFSTLCPGDYGTSAKIFNKVVEILTQRGVKGLGPSIDEGGKPVKSKGKVSENLSRGSLYRRRYHGRY